ncbi:RelA/SpoT domain-containing protein [Pseudomonas aeruginosa]
MEHEKKVFDSAINHYRSNFGDIEMWMRNVFDFFNRHPEVRKHVHSVKYRLKDPEHLHEKLHRKWDEDNPITADNLFERITDLAGVRVLLLHQQKFSELKGLIDNRLKRREWYLVEDPKAYTWDPEAKSYFESLGYSVLFKPSFYTSLHYVIKQHEESPYSCEVQIRTLFEEIWGEVDHSINYPKSTQNAACRDQIMVLAKLIGAGSRLVDSIFSTHEATKSQE